MNYNFKCTQVAGLDLSKNKQSNSANNSGKGKIEHVCHLLWKAFIIEINVTHSMACAHD